MAGLALLEAPAGAVEGALQGLTALGSHAGDVAGAAASSAGDGEGFHVGQGELFMLGAAQVRDYVIITLYSL